MTYVVKDHFGYFGVEQNKERSHWEQRDHLGYDYRVGYDYTIIGLGWVLGDVTFALYFE